MSINNLFECIICLDNIKYSAIGSCTHHFCYYCLLDYCKVCNKKNEYAKCPLCKMPINEIRLDREFDKILNNNILSYFCYQNEKILYPIDFVTNPGLTIKNNKKGPGVIIIKLQKDGLFKKYDFNIKDILLSVNGISCYSHITVIDQIMKLFQSRKIMNIVIL